MIHNDIIYVLFVPHRAHRNIVSFRHLDEDIQYLLVNQMQIKTQCFLSLLL